jgi:flagellar hook-associated protein 2
MANIQFGGLITGLDTNALVAGLVKAEQRSIAILQSQKVRFQAQDAVFASVIGALGSLKSSAQNLSVSTDFSKRSASSSDDAVLTVSASSTAAVGSSRIAVDSLAKAQSVQSLSFSQANAAIGIGTLTISVDGTGTAVVIDSTNNTLEGLRAAINDSGPGVTATIVNVSAGATADYRLVVQSERTGTANGATISGALTGGADPFAGGGEVVQAATDAVFAVNGLRVARSSNIISDVIPGITFTLLDEGDQDGVIDPTDPTVKISVAADNSAIKDAITELVENFNAVNKIVNEQFMLDSNTSRQGSTAGDAALRGMLSRLRAELSVAGGMGVGYAYLSDIGVQFKKDGSLTVDEGKISEALREDPTALANLFLGKENGLGKRIPEAVDDFISTVDGSLVFRQKGIGQSIKQIDDKIGREERRIATLEEQLVKKFAALEELVSQLKSQGDFLSQQLSALQNAQRKR